MFTKTHHPETRAGRRRGKPSLFRMAPSEDSSYAAVIIIPENANEGPRKNRFPTDHRKAKDAYIRRRSLLAEKPTGCAVPLRSRLCLLAFVLRARCRTPAQQATPVNASSYPVIPNGTRFLIALEEPLGTARNKVNDKFKARTLEPLAADNGSVIAPGAEIRGHISRIQPAALTGHARLWLTFDDIKTAERLAAGDRNRDRRTRRLQREAGRKQGRGNRGPREQSQERCGSRRCGRGSRRGGGSEGGGLERRGDWSGGRRGGRVPRFVWSWPGHRSAAGHESGN